MKKYTEKERKVIKDERNIGENESFGRKVEEILLFFLFQTPVSNACLNFGAGNFLLFIGEIIKTGN